MKVRFHTDLDMEKHIKNKIMKYYEVTVSVEVALLKSGKPKIKKELYLVDAQSCTEAEARVVKDFLSSSQNMDFTVSSAKESRILRVIE